MTDTQQHSDLLAETTETDEAKYERFVGEDGEEMWWRRNRVYGENTGDHRSEVLCYGGLELHAALNKILSLQARVRALEEEKAEAAKLAEMTVVAKSAIEIVQDCRAALDLPTGASLIDAVRALKADAARWEFVREELASHEQITLTFDKRRDNYSAEIQLGWSHGPRYTSLNYLDAGDDRPSVGQLLDEALDAARQESTNG